MEDIAIVDLYWQRNEDAIQQTQKKYDGYLRKISYNVLANVEDCEECVNDTYLAAWNSMPTNRPEILCTYLGKIVRQIAIDVFRKKHALKRFSSEYAVSLDELSEIIPNQTTPEEMFDGKVLAESINRFLRRLTEEERNLFIGRYYYFDPLKKVAKYCGMGEGKAKSMLYRTRQKLKEYLVKEGFAL